MKIYYASRTAVNILLIWRHRDPLYQQYHPPNISKEKLPQENNSATLLFLVFFNEPISYCTAAFFNGKNVSLSGTTIIYRQEKTNLTTTMTQQFPRLVTNRVYQYVLRIMYNMYIMYTGIPRRHKFPINGITSYRTLYLLSHYRRARVSGNQDALQHSNTSCNK